MARESWYVFWNEKEKTLQRVKEGDPRGRYLLQSKDAAIDPRYSIDEYPLAAPMTDEERFALLQPELKWLEERKKYLESELKAIENAPANKALKMQR